MGVFTEYDVLTGNPGEVYDPKENGTKGWEDKYDWQNKVRVVKKDGNVTSIGVYDSYGRVETDTEGKFEISIYNEEKTGHLINDMTYKYLKRHPLFNECVKKNNLYEIIEEFKPYNSEMGPTSKYVGVQELFIGGLYGENGSVARSDAWAYENPERNTIGGRKNKKRFENIIDKFLKHFCKQSEKKSSKKSVTKSGSSDRNITELYHNVKGSSGKFWKISYNPDKGGYHVIIFGRIGTDGRTVLKTDTLANIEKLIKSKKSKGYMLKEKEEKKSVKEEEIVAEEPVEKVVLKKTAKRKCTTRNPEPPCEDGYEERQTKKGDTCCYKSTKKRKLSVKPPSPPKGKKRSLSEDDDMARAIELSMKEASLEKKRRIEADRKLREEQDREYEEALKADMAKKDDARKSSSKKSSSGKELTIHELREARIRALSKKKSPEKKTKCEANIESNVMSKFNRGELKIRGNLVTSELTAQNLVKQMKEQYCKTGKVPSVEDMEKEKTAKKSSSGKKEEKLIKLTFKDGSSNKFYNIKVTHNNLQINFGRVGTKGRTTDQPVSSFKKGLELAEIAMKKKLSKGYEEVGGEKQKSGSSGKVTLKKKKGTVIFTKSPMLADKFYDPNEDYAYKSSGEYKKSKWVVYEGDSGLRETGRKWKFSKAKTLYAVDPKGWFISEKYDGVRAVWNGVNFVSRTGKVYEAPKWFKEGMPANHSLDGELHCGHGTFQQSTGITRHKVPVDKDWAKLTFQVFDIPDPDLVGKPFEERMKLLEKVSNECCDRWKSVEVPSGIRKPDCIISFTKQIKVNNMDHAYGIYKKLIVDGAEGAMLRKSGSKYEHKRSKILLKWKPSLDAEALVVGYNEGGNRLTTRLGTFAVKLIDDSTKKVRDDLTFNLSGRLTDEFRNQYRFKDGKIIKEPKKGGKYPVIGDIVTLTFMEYTDGGIPRQPIYQRIRREK